MANDLIDHMLAAMPLPAVMVDQSELIIAANADALTRVHLVATRFLPEHDLFETLAHAPRRGLAGGTPGRLPNLYISGRKIGDEYRYILERRYAEKFPGNKCVGKMGKPNRPTGSKIDANARPRGQAQCGQTRQSFRGTKL